MGYLHLVPTAIVLFLFLFMVILFILNQVCLDYSAEIDEHKDEEIYKLRDLFVTCYEVEQSNPNCVPASLEYDDEYAADRRKIDAAYDKYKNYVHLQEPFAPKTVPADASALLKQHMLEGNTVRLDPPEDPAKAMDRQVLLDALEETCASLGYGKGEIRINVQENDS